MIETARPANQAWYELVQDLYTHGREVQPRGILTREFMMFTSIVNMRYPVVTYPLRRLNYRFMAGEAWWILSGANDVKSIEAFNSRIAQFSDDGETFFGAYGPRIQTQFQYIVRTLEADPDSRQAVLTIWRENPPKTKDMPCTVAIQFLVRNHHLHCNVFMRSSDVWLGWPYDVFNFSMLSLAVLMSLKAKDMDLALGHLRLTAGSQHLYETNREAAEKLITESTYNAPHLQLHPELVGLNSPAELVGYLFGAAGQETNTEVLRRLVDGETK